VASSQDKTAVPKAAPMLALRAGVGERHWRSDLGERAIVELAVEPVAVAAEVSLHRHVERGLEQRDARYRGKGEANETTHLFGVFLRISPLRADVGRRGNRLGALLSNRASPRASPFAPHAAERVTGQARCQSGKAMAVIRLSSTSGPLG